MMNTSETIQIDPDRMWYVLPTLAEQKGANGPDVPGQGTKPSTRSVQKPNKAGSSSVPDVARRHNWKVGDKDVRQVGQGEMPDPGQPIDLGKCLVMQAVDYRGIVPHVLLERIQILLDEDIDIKGLLIADDLRQHKMPGGLSRFALHVIERARNTDWQRIRTAIAKSGSILASAISGVVTSIGSGAKRRAKEIDWDQARSVLGKSLKLMALTMLCFAGAIVALPILAIAAVPAALLTFDPWLIVVDSENRWWVVGEWFD